MDPYRFLLWWPIFYINFVQQMLRGHPATRTPARIQ
jgi:hypothetical protein